jgi:hypothetical protein
MNPAPAVPSEVEVALAAARPLIAAQRWAEAAAALEPVAPRDLRATLQLRLARNMAALREHRPEVYRQVVAVDPGPFRIVSSKTGILTVAIQRGTNLVSLSASDDPLAAARETLRQTHESRENGQPVAVCGLGDGYYVRALADHAPKLFLGRQHCVWVVEPEPALVLTCLMLHDYSPANGPIAQQRFRWFVGADYQHQMESAARRDVMLPLPMVSLRQGTRSQEIEDAVRGLCAAVIEDDKQLAAKVARRYATKTPAALAGVLARAAGRKPRVLLITTRYSTVLQYSTRDSAEGLEAIGCEVRVLIEPSPVHLLTRYAMRSAVAEFEPDLIFQIDHLRHEHGDLFPPEVPFVCWVQDNLPNLTTPDAGRRVGGRDFVLVMSAQRYVSNYAYPERQCLEFRKLTKLPARPAAWASDGDDLAYVSNCSYRADDVCDQVARTAGDFEPLVREVGQRMIDTYADGGSLHTQGEVRRLLLQTARECDVSLRGDFVTNVVSVLFERLNNCLFRQQGLRWAAQVARERNLKLAIYGTGWATHPDFAEFARGNIEYGAKLEEMTRRTKVNLVLEPYVCTSHQRVLDGLAAGGFMLIRSHPHHDLLRQLIDQLARVPADARTAADAMLALDDPAEAAALSQLIADFLKHDATPGAIDYVRAVRDLQAGRFLPDSGEVLPDLELTSFEGAEGLRDKLDLFLPDAARRADVAGRQRAFVESTMQYSAGMRTMLDWVAARMAETAAGTAPSSPATTSTALAA